MPRPNPPNAAFCFLVKQRHITYIIGPKTNTSNCATMVCKILQPVGNFIMQENPILSSICWGSYFMDECTWFVEIFSMTSGFCFYCRVGWAWGYQAMWKAFRSKGRAKMTDLFDVPQGFARCPECGRVLVPLKWQMNKRIYKCGSLDVLSRKCVKPSTVSLPRQVRQIV